MADSPSEQFQFLAPLAEKALVSRSDRHAEFKFRPTEGMPDGLRVNLRSPGFELHVSGRLTLKFASLQRPWMTVEGASFDGPPTPVAKWMVLSFQEPQPPVMFATPEANGVDWEIAGQTGAWTLSTREPFEGWIRVCAPMGRNSLDRASKLGDLALQLSGEGPMWAEPASRLVDAQVSPKDGFIQAVWTFDRPSSLVPPALLLCRAGGADVNILSGLAMTTADLAEGPQGFSAEPRWVFQFPLKELPPGRAVVRGELAAGASEEKQWIALLTSAGDPAWGKKQALVEGSPGMTDLGRAALARTALSRWGWKPPQEDASPAQKLLWARDFSSMTLFGGSPAECGEAAGWLAMALAIDSDPAQRLEGCLLWAGLSAQLTLPEYRRKRGLGDIALKRSLPLPDVLASLFGQKIDVPSKGWEILNSPVRILSTQRLVVNADTLEWKPVKGEGPLKLIAPPETVWKPVSGTILLPEFDGHVWTMRAVPGEDGKCRLEAKLPGLPDLR